MAKSLPYNNLKNPIMDPSTFGMVSGSLPFEH